jgi:hypothetical protein
MARKGPARIDYAVMPLEGLWWSGDMDAFVNDDRSTWRWTMMIHQPRFVDTPLLHDALAEVKHKKGLAGIDALRLETSTEGLCAQTLHVGPFTAQGPRSGSLAGKHHDI